MSVVAVSRIVGTFLGYSPGFSIASTTAVSGSRSVRSRSTSYRERPGLPDRIRPRAALDRRGGDERGCRGETVCGETVAGAGAC